MISMIRHLYSKTLHLTQSHALHTNDESLDDLSLRASYWISEKVECWLYSPNQKYKEEKSNICKVTKNPNCNLNKTILKNPALL